MALISAPLRIGSYKHVKGDQLVPTLAEVLSIRKLLAVDEIRLRIALGGFKRPLLCMESSTFGSAPASRASSSLSLSPALSTDGC